jgi:hypothetical protein
MGCIQAWWAKHLPAWREVGLFGQISVLFSRYFDLNEDHGSSGEKKVVLVKLFLNALILVWFHRLEER